MSFREKQRARAARWTLLEGVDWSEVHRRLALFAYRRLGTRGSVALAEDLAGEAVTAFLASAYDAWNPEETPLLRALGSTLNGLLANHRKTSTRRGHVPDPDGTIADAVAFGNASHEVEARDLTRRAVDKLEEALTSDALALRVVREMMQGVETPREQCQATGASMHEILAARRRIERLTSRFKAELLPEETAS